VALVSPMRDGMNLVCKEYVASRLDKKGVLILSEMAGASKELSDAIIVNPNDIHQLVEAMHKALTMPEALQIESMTSMQKSLKRYNIHAWVKLFMDELANVKKEQSHLKTRLIDNQLSEEIKHAYKQSKERLIFLDYDGTLVGFNENPDDSKPDQELIEILERLTKDKNNHIVIISGRGRQFLEEWMKPYSLDIVAEHGVWIKRMGKPFKTFIKINASWKKETMSLLERYVNRTPGSFVEEKDYSLVWHYRKVETGLGEVRTRELTSHLKYMTANENLEVLEGDMIVEIKNSEINKGKAAQKLMEIYPEADFLLALGDDFTDEDTFKAMPEEAYTIKVGTSASEAKFSVNSYKEVRKLLNEIIKS
jgi:trehalose 6-phosphate synthase/phosphatase